MTPPSVSPYYYAYSHSAGTGNIFNVYQWNRSVNNYSTLGIAYANYYRHLAIKEFEEKIIDNDTHHAEFVRNYVDDIALALQAYGLAEGYNLSDQFYQDLVWGGLTHWTKRDGSGNIIEDELGNPLREETPWFKDNFPDEADRTRILNTIATELTGEDIHGNTQTQKGENAGC